MSASSSLCYSSGIGVTLGRTIVMYKPHREYTPSRRSRSQAMIWQWYIGHDNGSTSVCQGGQLRPHTLGQNLSIGQADWTWTSGREEKEEKLTSGRKEVNRGNERVWKGETRHGGGQIELLEFSRDLAGCGGFVLELLRNHTQLSRAHLRPSSHPQSPSYRQLSNVATNLIAALTASRPSISELRVADGPLGRQHSHGDSVQMAQRRRHQINETALKFEKHDRT